MLTGANRQRSRQGPLSSGSLTPCERQASPCSRPQVLHVLRSCARPQVLCRRDKLLRSRGMGKNAPGSWTSCERFPRRFSDRNETRRAGRLRVVGRANRLAKEGGIFHVTHRCHKRAFPLKFACDRDAYRAMLRRQLRRAQHGAMRHGQPPAGMGLAGLSRDYGSPAPLSVAGCGAVMLAFGNGRHCRGEAQFASGAGGGDRPRAGVKPEPSWTESLAVGQHRVRGEDQAIASIAQRDRSDSNSGGTKCTAGAGSALRAEKRLKKRALTSNTYA
jgi:hypothetical protein